MHLFNKPYMQFIASIICVEILWKLKPQGMVLTGDTTTRHLSFKAPSLLRLKGGNTEEAARRMPQVKGVSSVVIVRIPMNRCLSIAVLI